MSPNTKIFITGATGYIGGSVLERLLKHPDASKFEITVIIRSPQKASKLKDFGVNSVVGSFSDEQLLEDLAASADVIIDTADADNVAALRSMLLGSKRRFHDSGKAPYFIHTSGIAVVSDKAAGLRSSDTTYDDANPDQLETLPPTTPHRDSNLEVLQADKAGYVKAYLVTPCTVYGFASGELVDAALMNKHSIQLPMMVNIAISRGRAGMVGKGVNIWPNVFIDDSDCGLVYHLFDVIRANPDTVGHGRSGYYFGLGGEHRLYDVAKEVGRVLTELGKISSGEPTSFTQEVNNYSIDAFFLGTNARGTTNNSRSIGWKPTKTTEDFMASIKPEVEEILRTGYRVPGF